MEEVELTDEMEKFLDNCIGKDLIKSAYEFRIKFGLTYDQTSELIEQWKTK